MRHKNVRGRFTDLPFDPRRRWPSHPPSGVTPDLLRFPPFCKIHLKIQRFRAVLWEIFSDRYFWTADNRIGGSDTSERWYMPTRLPNLSPHRLKLCLCLSLCLCVPYTTLSVSVCACLSSFASVSYLHPLPLVSSILEFLWMRKRQYFKHLKFHALYGLD